MTCITDMYIGRTGLVIQCVVGYFTREKKRADYMGKQNYNYQRDGWKSYWWQQLAPIKLIKLLNKKLSIILKRWKKVSHTDPFLLLPFFLFIFFSHLNEYVQHAGIFFSETHFLLWCWYFFSVRLPFSFDSKLKQYHL